MCVCGCVGVGAEERWSEVKHSLEDKTKAHANLYGCVHSSPCAGGLELTSNLSFV